jgi:hypothetical protein
MTRSIGRPEFFSDPAMDRLVAIITSLATELSVTRDRLAAVEAVLGNKGLLSSEELETAAANPEEREQRAARQRALVDRLFYVLEREGVDDIRE